MRRRIPVLILAVLGAVAVSRAEAQDAERVTTPRDKEAAIRTGRLGDRSQQTRVRSPLTRHPSGATGDGP